jgi:RNA polymerase sigma-70 factor (ECF subfamily)
MSTEDCRSTELLQQAAAGDHDAVNALFGRYRERLRAMVRLRINRRLKGRIDASDVLQEAYLEVCKGFAEYVRDPPLPFYLWLRHLTGQKLIALHRHHLGARMRTAEKEILLHAGALPRASSMSLAAQLLGRLTSPSQAALKAELRIRVQEALNSMDPLDREVLALRHFEMLTNAETAQVLGLKKTAASNRYVRALERLKEILAAIPDFAELE